MVRDAVDVARSYLQASCFFQTIMDKNLDKIDLVRYIAFNYPLASMSCAYTAGLLTIKLLERNRSESFIKEIVSPVVACTDNKVRKIASMLIVFSISIAAVLFKHENEIAPSYC